LNRQTDSVHNSRLEPDSANAAQQDIGIKPQNSFIRSLLIFSLVLAVPILPFLLWNEALTDWVKQGREHWPAREWIAMLVVGLLASDILLPIPSSFVCTWAGAEFGVFLATGLTWLGMTLGASLGFAMARTWGARCVAWFTNKEDMTTVAEFAERYGSVLLALARGVPVVAEASVLWLGMHRLSWRAFLFAVVPSNLVLALVYALLGEIAAEHEWLPIALAGSVALPLGLLEWVRRYSAKLS
jgi:uncharacterized membrane protein YdjX (TVP38/TMEM64 family)